MSVTFSVFAVKGVETIKDHSPVSAITVSVTFSVFAVKVVETIKDHSPVSATTVSFTLIKFKYQISMQKCSKTVLGFSLAGDALGDEGKSRCNKCKVEIKARTKLSQAMPTDQPMPCEGNWVGAIGHATLSHNSISDVWSAAGRHFLEGADSKTL